MDYSGLKEPHPEQSFQQNEDDADEEDALAARQAQEFLKQEETGQSWILRHLRSHLKNVDEKMLTGFIMQQVILIV